MVSWLRHPKSDEGRGSELMGIALQYCSGLQNKPEKKEQNMIFITFSCGV